MYKYTTKSLLDNPLNYSYSSYEGDEFLKRWYIHRLSYCKELSQHYKLNNKTLTYPKLPDILSTIGSRNSRISEENSCNFLLHKYETTKKLYSQYIDNKPYEKYGFKNIDYYVSTALMIENFYSKSKELRYLNCLIKLCDLFR